MPKISHSAKRLSRKEQNESTSRMYTQVFQPPENYNQQGVEFQSRATTANFHPSFFSSHHRSYHALRVNKGKPTHIKHVSSSIMGVAKEKSNDDGGSTKVSTGPTSKSNNNGSKERKNSLVGPSDLKHSATRTSSACTSKNNVTSSNKKMNPTTTVSSTILGNAVRWDQQTKRSGGKKSCEDYLSESDVVKIVPSEGEDKSAGVTKGDQNVGAIATNRNSSCSIKSLSERVQVTRTQREKEAHPETISLERCGLKTFPLISGEGPELKLLSLQHNLLTRLENVSSCLNHLVVLDLYDNRIERITSLHGLTSLRVLLLGKNR